MSEFFLHVEFCKHLARIECSDYSLYRELEQYFRHCLRPQRGAPRRSGPVVATYQVTFEDERWQLWQDGRVVHVAPEAFYIYMFLTRNVAAKLVTRCRRQMVFHAAGLACQDQGVILCGRSNSGKSTLTAWLTATGFDFLADDIAAVGTTPFELSGLPCPIVLKAGSKFVWDRWLAEKISDPSIRFFGGSAWIDPELLRPACVRPAVEPKLLIFPTYVAGRPLTVQRLRPAEAAFQLMPRLINFANLPRRGLAEVTGLARRVIAYNLVHSDVAAAAAWIEQTMAALPAGGKG